MTPPARPKDEPVNAGDGDQAEDEEVEAGEVGVEQVALKLQVSLKGHGAVDPARQRDTGEAGKGVQPPRAVFLRPPADKPRQQVDAAKDEQSQSTVKQPGDSVPIGEAERQGVEQKNKCYSKEIESNIGGLRGEARAQEQTQGELGDLANGSASGLHPATVRQMETNVKYRLPAPPLMTTLSACERPRATRRYFLNPACPLRIISLSLGSSNHVSLNFQPEVLDRN